MSQNEYLSQSSTRKRIRQQVSIPFLWEVKPGIPKRHWKPNPVAQVNPFAPPPPIKLIASVPFEWEELPGKPLPCFPQPAQELPLLLLPPPPPLGNSPTHTMYSQENDDNWDAASAIDGDDEDDMFDSYLDAWGFETESFDSAPSLVANRLLPTVAISSAVPVQENFLMDRDSDQLQAPSSPSSDTDSSTSSYATGNMSLVGAPFLERLFPLLSPKSSFLKKVGCSQQDIPHTPQRIVPDKVLDRESNSSLIKKRPLTLGELILMSRRRSYHRRAMLKRDQNLSMEFMKKSALGCCMFGSSDRIKDLQRKWKRHLLLT